jgi:hypothetical protein
MSKVDQHGTAVHDVRSAASGTKATDRARAVATDTRWLPGAEAADPSAEAADPGDGLTVSGMVNYERTRVTASGAHFNNSS